MTAKTPTAPTSRVDLSRRIEALKREHDELAAAIDAERDALGIALLANDPATASRSQEELQRQRRRADELTAELDAAERALAAAGDAEAKAARAALVAEHNAHLDAAAVELVKVLNHAAAIAEPAAAAKAELLAAERLSYRLTPPPDGALSDRRARPAWPFGLLEAAVKGSLSPVFGTRFAEGQSAEAIEKLRGYCARLRLPDET